MFGQAQWLELPLLLVREVILAFVAEPVLRVGVIVGVAALRWIAAAMFRSSDVAEGHFGDAQSTA